MVRNSVHKEMRIFIDLLQLIIIQYFLIKIGTWLFFHLFFIRPKTLRDVSCRNLFRLLFLSINPIFFGIFIIPGFKNAKKVCRLVTHQFSRFFCLNILSVFLISCNSSINLCIFTHDKFKNPYFI